VSSPGPGGGTVFDGPDGVQVVLPMGTDAPAGTVRIAAAADVPPPPEGLAAAGQAYEVLLPAQPERFASPAFVRLPLPDPAVAGDPTRFVAIGRHDGTKWTVFPAEVEDGWALAAVDHFCKFRVLIGIVRDKPTAEELARLRIGTPRLWGVRVSGITTASAIFDVSAARTASTGAWFRRSVAVPRLRVYVSRPQGTARSASPRIDRFVPFRHLDEDVYLDTSRSRPSFFLEWDDVATMAVTKDDTVNSAYVWRVRFAPVFADGTEGPNLSEEVLVPAGPAEAQTKLGNGLQAHLDAATGGTFRQQLKDNPYILFFDPWLIPEAYGQASGGVRRRLNAMLWSGQLRSYIGLTGTSTYEAVICHEWGHYAVNLTYGDDAFAGFPGGGHAGWRAADSRGLAFSEGLAHFFGQWGTGAGVPPGAGAMAGLVTDMARRPGGENDVGSCWPNSRDMDASRVESVWSTVLSRAAGTLGFQAVYDVLHASHPMDGLAFFDAWAANGDAARTGALQLICLQEGVAWAVRGRVMTQPLDPPDAEPVPVEGAQVRLAALDGLALAPDPQTVDTAARPLPATTDADGYFELYAPPGDSRFVIEKDGLTRRQPDTRTIDTTPATNAPSQPLEPFFMDPLVPPVVEITAPADGSTVTERVLTVTGTVTGTQTGMPDGPPIERAQVFVNADAYDVTVSGGQLSQQVLLGPGDARIRLVASNAAGETEATVGLTADIEATVLKVVLTWAGAGTDVDLWVTDPEGVATGYTNKSPADGRQLDIDDRDGFGPETYTVTRSLPGTYQVRINYFAGEDGESFRVRWVIHEATPQQQTGETAGSLSDADRNEGKPAANHSFTIQVP
jgi:hypothetical protein